MRTTKPKLQDVEHTSLQKSGIDDHAKRTWWQHWAKDHEDQIKNYNDDVASAGIWSDQLRSF